MTRPMPGPPEDCYCRFGNATCQECETRGYPYSWGLCPGCELHNGRDLGAYKRLKDVECAAERGEARADWMYMKFLIASRQIVSMRARPNAPMPEPSPPLERKLNEARDRHYTWERFATRPHALEES